VFVLLCGCLPFDDDSSALSSESVQAKFQLRFPSWASEYKTALPPPSPPSPFFLQQSMLALVLPLSAKQALAHPWVCI